MERSPIEDRMDHFEKQLIEQALLENGLNISRTAQALNMSRNTLYARIRRLGIQVKKHLR